MKNVSICNILILILFLAACTNEESRPEPEEAAEEVLALLRNGEYETIHEVWFDEELQNSLSADDFGRDWEEKTDEGEWVETSSLKAESRTENTKIVETTLELTTYAVDVRMIFNKETKLVGFSLSKGIPHAEMPQTIIEEEIVVGEGTEYKLDGLLTLPAASEAKLPAVILIQGSGPTDRDETAFAYKPFRDLAWGLSEQGIAVIRYDKRTYTYGNEMMQFAEELTVYEETVEDAVRATEFAKADPRIDENQVYIAGHSLGGMLAPRIDAAGGDYAGLVVLAGSPRPLWEIVYDQNMAVIESLTADEAEKKELTDRVEKELNKAKAIEEMSDREARDIMIFGINGYYLKEMDEYNVSSLVSKLEKPFLILQGEDDFQVYYEKDFVKWQELLDGRNDVTFISYPGLNHFFIEYEGPDKGTIAEYETPNQVDAKVIEDIGHWILEQE